MEGRAALFFFSSSSLSPDSECSRTTLVTQMLKQPPLKCSVINSKRDIGGVLRF